MKTTATAVLLILASAASAAVPLRWTVESSRVQPAQFDAVRGETLALEATFNTYGKPLEMPSQCSLWWQTNGMGTAYWVAPATVSSNRISTVWLPEMDVGAKVYNCFLGATGEIYRACFQLRFRDGPGAIPNVLPLPVATLDFSRVTIVNPPYYTQAEVDAHIASAGGVASVNGMTGDVAIREGHTDAAVKALASERIAAEGCVSTNANGKLEIVSNVPEEWLPGTIELTPGYHPTIEIKGDIGETAELKVGSAIQIGMIEPNQPRIIVADRGTGEHEAEVVIGGGWGETPVVNVRADINALKAYVAALGTPGYSWSRPDAWRLGYELNEDVTSVTDYTMSYDDSMIFSNVTEQIVYSLSARCFGERLDETSIEPVIVENWGHVTEGCSVTGDGVVTATEPGLYRISAAVSNEVRYVDVPLGNHPDATKRTTYYVDDTNAARRAVNDAALAVLNSATLISSENYYESRRYNTYATFVPRMTNPGWGVYGYALSRHCLLTAWHYFSGSKGGDVPSSGTITFNDGNGNLATMTRLEWVRLYDWALTNGWAEAELKKCKGIGDIAVGRCAKTAAIPDGCIPYFTDEQHILEWFGSRGLYRLAGWRYAFDCNSAVPVVFENEFGGYANDGAAGWRWGTHPFRARPDIESVLDTMIPLSGVHIGDSGKPVFFIRNGQQIVVSQWTSAGSGPDLPSAFPIIKAFVESYGDTIKEAR